MSADLFEEHRQIIALAEELLALVSRRPCASVEEIAELRVRLSNLGIAHLRAEDELIMKPLLVSGRVSELPGAAAIIGEIRASYSFYSTHANRWTMRAIEADRQGYAQALTGMLDHLRGIIMREETLLYLPVIRLLKTQPDTPAH
jgi:hypothetical protein